MKHLLWTLTASLLMISCGDFYQFGEEPDDWDGVSMRITNGVLRDGGRFHAAGNRVFGYV